jgi:anthranilate phosphoribosyltransferase
MEQFISQLQQAVDLTDAQVCQAVARLIDEQVPVEMKANFLTALARKGETVQEIFAFARELRNHAIPLPLDSKTRAGVIIDVCGTGGDRLNTFNISTTVSFILAAAGIAVAKHGNRAITSRSGSADVLEALGIRTDFSPAEAAAALREHQFSFLFAPHYHPAFKHIAPARQFCAKQGQRTVFNILGPLLNPARPTAQLIGVPRPHLCEPMARALQALGIQQGFVVSGCVTPEGAPASLYLDEFSTLGANMLAEFHYTQDIKCSTPGLASFPLQRATLEDLRGGERNDNAEIVRQILSGKDRGPRRDAVLLNAGGALVIAGKAGTMIEGWSFAAELIDTGAAMRKLQDLVAISKR